MHRILAMIISLGLTGSALADAASACRETVMDYAYYWDQGDVDAFAALFTPDATLTLGDTELRGREAIAERLRESTGQRVYRHLMTTMKLTPEAERRVSGISYVTVYVGEREDDGMARVDGFALMGEYHDRFQLDADRCRITERKLVPVLQQR